LLNISFGTDENGDPGPRLLRLGPEGQASMRDFEKWLEPQLSDLGNWAA
jgi:hypothetical protein